MLESHGSRPRRFCQGLPVLALLLSLPFLVALRPDYPPIENLIRAQEAVGRAQVMVDELASKISGEYRPPACEQIRSKRLCHKTEGCVWSLSPRSERGYCHGGVNENDAMANFILLGLGRDLNELGETIDQATAAYGTPAFWHHQHQACNIAKRLQKGTHAGKTAARIPPQGIATPDAFQGIEQEVHEVQNLLSCF